MLRVRALFSRASGPSCGACNTHAFSAPSYVRLLSTGPSDTSSGPDAPSSDNQMGIPSRGSLELMSSRLCLRQSERLVDMTPAKFNESSVWLTRAESELARAKSSFGSNASKKHADELAALASAVSKAGLEHEMKVQGVSTQQDQNIDEEVDEEEQQESVIKYYSEDYTPEGGHGAFAKMLADVQINIGSYIAGEKQRAGLEYVVKRTGLYRENDRLLFANGHEAVGDRLSMHRVWAIALRSLCQTYSMAEFMEGAEMAFCAYNKALFDATQTDASGLGDLENMIPAWRCEEMNKRVSMQRRINQQMEISNKSFTPKKYRGCGGHKLLSINLDNIRMVNAKFVDKTAELDPLLCVTVSFESEMEDPVDAGVSDETRTRKETATYHFFSRRPVDCDLTWGIVDSDLAILDVALAAAKGKNKDSE